MSQMLLLTFEVYSLLDFWPPGNRKFQKIYPARVPRCYSIEVFEALFETAVLSEILQTVHSIYLAPVAFCI